MLVCPLVLSLFNLCVGSVGETFGVQVITLLGGKVHWDLPDSLALTLFPPERAQSTAHVSWTSK